GKAGEGESGKAGKRESGKAGKRESEKAGKRENGRAGERESGKAAHPREDMHMKKIVDSHIHLDHVYKRRPDRVVWLREKGCAVISWAWAAELENAGHLKRYLQSQAALIHELHGDPLACYYLTGIHPRNITGDLRPGMVAAMLTPFLEDPLCLGVGEIGLETGSAREKEILAAQLDLATTVRGAGKRFGVHTPRSNKPEITRQLLETLENHPGIEDILVIDHCSEEILGLVLERGYWAGVTLSPIKTSPESLARMIEAHPDKLERIMCNTDSGTRFHEDLLKASQSNDIAGAVKERIFYKNASRFFGIPTSS
ncbi:MAG: hypothetical protein GY859_12370, partial [Desulfobacterales bacterium]|nr:hypothetical protein [Desulfobacterales bacterium]